MVLSSCSGTPTMTFRAPGEQDAGQEECVGAEWGCLGSRLPSTSRAFGWSQDPLDWVVEVLGGGLCCHRSRPSWACSNMLALPLLRLTADHGSVVPGKVAALLHPPPQSLLSRGWKKSTDFLTHRLFSLAPSQGGSSFRRYVSQLGPK